MLGKPDAQGKYALSGNEYYAIREIFAVLSAYETSMEFLRDRAKLKPGVWRDMRLVSSKSQNIIAELMRTVPAKKLQLIMTELPNTYITVDVRPPRGAQPVKRPDYAYVPAAALDELICRVMDVDCFACEKRGRAIKKCPLRAMIEDTFPYDIPEPDNDGCKFAGCHIDRADTRYETEDNDA